MRKIFLAVLLSAFAVPSVVLAQGFPGGMTPELQAQMQTLRTNAATAAYAAMSVDHRTKVQAIITSFNNGGVTIPDAVKQIDAILTPAEAAAILDQGQKAREAMRAAFMAAAAASGATPPPRRPDAGQGQGENAPRRPPDAGRVMLSIAASQDALRAAMQP
ncbi:MAG TPA: hypothetical protein VGR69_10475 [Candidatus Rubrimentiphilum sp.]|nr:hypothetical protein [Candidatus Rubrimentiphilum sp.]